MASTRDHAGEYFTACAAERTAPTIAGRMAAQKVMRGIERSAASAGVGLDLLGIDEAARRSLIVV